MGAGPLRRPKASSEGKKDEATSKEEEGPTTAPPSPRRKAYQKIKSISDLRFVRKPSSKELVKADSSKSSVVHSFSDLARASHLKTGGLPSVSAHSDVSMDSLTQNRDSEPQATMIDPQAIREARQQQLKSREGGSERREGESSPESSPGPPPLHNISVQDPTITADLDEMKETNAKIVEDFKMHVHHWVTIFDLVPREEFERAVMRELLNLVAAVPICKDYAFWKGFCTTVEKRMALTPKSRVMKVLHRVHPSHTLPPLKKPRPARTSRDCPRRVPGGDQGISGQQKAGRRDHGHREGRGGRGGRGGRSRAPFGGRDRGGRGRGHGREHGSNSNAGLQPMVRSTHSS